MNSINNGWDSTKREETHYFFTVVPQIRTKMGKKRKRDKKI